MSRRWAAIALLFALVLAIPAWHLLANGSGTGPGGTGSDFGFEPLGPSGPQETALRLVRLAGVEHASVWSDGDIAAMRIEVPAINTPADPAIAWQAGAAALLAAYPDASACVVQLFAGGQPLIQVRYEAGALRDPAVELGPCTVLFTYPPLTLPAEEHPQRFGPTPDDWLGEPGSAVVVGVHLPDRYLEAKNIAAGLRGPVEQPRPAAGQQDPGTADDTLQGPASAMRQRIAAFRSGGEGITAASSDVGAGKAWAMRAIAALDAQEHDLAAELADDIAGVLDEDHSASTVRRLKSLALVAFAVERTALDRSLIDDALPLSDALSGAAFDPHYEEALSALSQTGEPTVPIEELTRQEPDVSAAELQTPQGLDLLPALFIRADGLRVAGVSDRPRSWTVWSGEGWGTYYAPDSGAYAICFSPVEGWAWSHDRIAVVDAADLGRTIAILAVE